MCEAPDERLVGGVNQRVRTACSPACRSSASPPLPAICGAARRRSLDLARRLREGPASSSGVRSASFQAIAHLLADLQTEVERRANSDAGARPGTATRGRRRAASEISMAKLFASETYVKVANARHAGARRLWLQYGVRHAAPLPRCAQRRPSAPAPRRSSAT